MTLKILGTGSASPTLQFHPSAQLLMMGNEYFLIDCGEGTQYRLLENKVKTHRISHIFISHLHGDHYFGLVGLLSSWNLNSRKEDLTIVAPRGLAEILTIQMKYADSRLRFKVNFIETQTTENYTILDLPNFTIETIPLQHRVACCGFLFRAKTKSFAYCSDTCYLESIVPIIQHADLLYHEATFTEANSRRAAETFHSTAREAAEIAKKAGVKQLAIGHYSSRYKELETHLSEAQAVFENTLLAVEGQEYVIG